MLKVAGSARRSEGAKSGETGVWVRAGIQRSVGLKVKSEDEAIVYKSVGLGFAGRRVVDLLVVAVVEVTSQPRNLALGRRRSRSPQIYNAPLGDLEPGTRGTAWTMQVPKP